MRARVKAARQREREEVRDACFARESVARRARERELAREQGAGPGRRERAGARVRMTASQGQALLRTARRDRVVRAGKEWAVVGPTRTAAWARQAAVAAVQGRGEKQGGGQEEG